jgi:hypothetical protein
MSHLHAVTLALALLLPCAPTAAANGHDHRMERGHGHAHAQPTTGAPTEAGQSAFAAVQEIAAMLERDPDVDWAKVDLEALRRHLIDMDNVTLRAHVESVAVPGGARFTVTGVGDVKASIQRMAPAHVASSDGTDGWQLSHEAHADGAVVTVRADSDADAVKIRALGFIGVLVRGMHHQQHHLMIARGDAPHH